MRFSGLAYQSRVRTLNGMRGLGAFDPRTRSLNGLGCSCQQNQNVGRLGFLARGGTNPLNRGVGRLGRFGRLRRLGDDGTDDFTPADNYFLDTGTDLTAPLTSSSAVASTYDSYSNSLTSPTLNLGPLTSPQQIAAQQIWGTTSITSAQNQALIAAQTAGYNLANLSAQQIASIKSAGGTSLLGTPQSSLLVWGALGLGLVLLLTKK